MSSITRRHLLLKAISEELEQAYDDTLEDVLELLKIRKSEDEEDLRDIQAAKEDIKINGTVPWSEIKREIA
ncbi:hypothetical protein WA1_14630 [Scytonema hofmannii PCC 7110]|uniref:Addiction module component n=1 Tax=Scytonema hofmannii PCC 7110 TaxID=128403 RepID=A0A139XF56_9CYAN|nr:hypothetical protein [Scytonema hofmannii]KYC43316.1 hypothetical protein WA1_14630 [Scytonema hofmannii PCC 7110]